MDEEIVKVILADMIKDDNSLCSSYHYIDWSPGEEKATLDDSFTADELEAIAWWMRNKNSER